MFTNRPNVLIHSVALIDNFLITFESQIDMKLDTWITELNLLRKRIVRVDY